MKRLLAVTILLAGCAQAGPRPDDMSAAGHRREAARERQRAQRELGTQQRVAARVDGRVPGDMNSYIPTEEIERRQPPTLGTGHWHLSEAELRAEHARQHEAAAAELERFEEAECGAVPPAERAACPLLVGVGVILDVQGGVEVRFASGAPVDGLVQRMRCHYAYARTRGFETAEGCPLYVKGLKIDRTGPRILRITGPDAASTDAIRERSRDLVMRGNLSTGP